jgi:hypothetical protein
MALRLMNAMFGIESELLDETPLGFLLHLGDSFPRVAAARQPWAGLLESLRDIYQRSWGDWEATEILRYAQDDAYE